MLNRDHPERKHNVTHSSVIFGTLFVKHTVSCPTHYQEIAAR